MVEGNCSRWYTAYDINNNNDDDHDDDSTSKYHNSNVKIDMTRT